MQVTTKSNLRELSRRLHIAVADIPKELSGAAERVTRRLPVKLKGSALSTLPHRGGLNRNVAFNARFRIQRVPNGSRVVAQHEYDLEALDRGRTTHPLFGDKRHWYRESVDAGWWSKVITGLEPQARREMEQALENIKREIEG